MILAVDTSTQFVGLALHDGGQIIGEMTWQSKNHHTVEVASAIDQLLAKTGVSKDGLDALAVALGPGSFTSLRIGLAVVKGLALALNIPVIGVPTHEIIASVQEKSELPMAAVIQAGRGRLAVQDYFCKAGKWQSNGEPVVLRVDEFSARIQAPTLVCGELSSDEREYLAKNNKDIKLVKPVLSIRRPAQLAEIAWVRYRKNEVDDIVTIAPIYLHVGDPIPS